MIRDVGIAHDFKFNAITDIAFNIFDWFLPISNEVSYFLTWESI